MTMRDPSEVIADLLKNAKLFNSRDVFIMDWAGKDIAALMTEAADRLAASPSVKPLFSYRHFKAKAEAFEALLREAHPYTNDVAHDTELWLRIDAALAASPSGAHVQKTPESIHVPADVHRKPFVTSPSDAAKERNEPESFASPSGVGGDNNLDAERCGCGFQECPVCDLADGEGV